MNEDKRQFAKKLKKIEKKWIILLIAFIFMAVSTGSVIFYTRWLDSAFQDNVEFYMNEISNHDANNVEVEIDRQWQKLETIGSKLSLERYEDMDELQHFLNLEMKATNFDKLMLIDEKGNAYEANYLIEDMSKQNWMKQLSEDKKPFVVRNHFKYQLVLWENSLLYGIPVQIKIKDTAFIGIVGSYQTKNIRDSLQTEFFNGEGSAQVVSSDGTIITTDVTERGESLENLLDQLQGGSAKSGDDYEDIKRKLAGGEPFDSIYRSADGKTMLLTAHTLSNADWMIVLSVPVSVASSQTAAFLQITAVMMIILCIIIGIILLYAFIAYRRTMILKNSKDIFYREKLFNLLTMHTEDVFIMEDAHTGKLNFISENITRIMGITPTADAEADLSYVPEHTRKQIADGKKEMIASAEGAGDHVRKEYEFEWTMPQDGSKKWIHLTVYTAAADFIDGQDLSLLIVLSDYTQIKEQQKILEKAARQAQEAADSKSLFLSNMSHEMRTPLNGIVGCIRLMKSNLNEPDKLKGYMDKAEYTSLYLTSLVSDILDMSKIENHKLILEERELSLAKICSNIEIMFQSGMEEKGIHYSVAWKEPLWIVLGDQVRIQQILTNLLSNAMKFTNSGGTVSLTVEQKQLDHENIKTIFTVSDTGIGMSQAFLKRIWTPFEQERLNTARLHGGTGLGLAITHELVELMKGTITVTSEIDVGSSFRIELIQRAIRKDIEKTEEPKMPEIAKEWLKDKTILVAEDNELNMEIITEMLKEYGAHVISAVNGKEAVAVFEKMGSGEINMILMDMQMPIMDGCSAAQVIRKLEGEDAGKVIIVACTANAFQEDIEAAISAGMDGHIAKPIDMEKLAKLLYTLWKEKTG